VVGTPLLISPPKVAIDETTSGRSRYLVSFGLAAVASGLLIRLQPSYQSRPP